MYQAALEKGLYPSQRKLSESIGVDVSLISKSIALAKLPAAVMGAFTSPLDVQYRWAQPLGEALERDREGTLAKAAMITTAREQQALSPGSIFTQLCSASTPSHVVNRDLQLAGKKIGVCSINEKGAVFIRIPAGELSPALQDAFVQAVEQFFHGR